jgi:hypothetical protein
MGGRSGMTPVRLDLPYLMTDTDRHGNRRIFVRRHGRKVRIREIPGTQAFLRAYSEALDALNAIAGARGNPNAGNRATRLPRMARSLLFRFCRIPGAR